VQFRLADEGRRWENVSLLQEVARPRLGPPFAFDGGSWQLRFPRPAADRLEYLLEIDGALGPDPGNPLRAPGPFGDKSVVEWPEYTPPRWLDSSAAEGRIEPVGLRCRRLGGLVDALVYATPEPPGEGAPLLVVHDGPEYAQYSRLTRFLDAMSEDGRIPPLWAALLPPVDRNETYSASAVYAAALTRELLPELRRHLAHGPRVGVGASLGALALLHAHVRQPGHFDALLLQSGSFFRQRFDKVESTFGRFARITRFVGTVLSGAVLRGSGDERAIPVMVTCGTAEENLANNRALVAALGGRGYPVRLAEVRDAHNWVCWRDALDPHLVDLLQAVL
jgi:enterochelin esterase-like enzyme